MATETDEATGVWDDFVANAPVRKPYRLSITGDKDIVIQPPDTERVLQLEEARTARAVLAILAGDDYPRLYELIKKSKHTTRIAKLIEEHDDIKELLSSADKDHTFFVPTDKALEKLPKHKDGKGPSKEVIKAVLKYHLVPEANLAKHLLGVHTLPTLLGGDQLSHDPEKTPQRLTVGFGLGGIRLNKFVRIVLGNVRGSNGVIHAVNHILIPPPRLGAVVTLFPTVFSQFDLAFKKTNLGDEIAYNEHYGATLFVPSAHAWPKLGYKANAFLFSKWGNKYLRALLLYHVVGNQTLYTDHFYGPEGDDAASIPKGRYHLDLPTLLHGKTVGVDIGRYGGLIRMHVNHFSRVVQNDIIARDGVIQIVNSVLIPPHKKHGHHDGESEIEVEDLKERLEEFMTAEDRDEVENELDWLNLEL